MADLVDIVALALGLVDVVKLPETERLKLLVAVLVHVENDADFDWPEKVLVPVKLGDFTCVSVDVKDLLEP